MNVDYASEWYDLNNIDINFNFFKNDQLPIESNKGNIIYTSHTIEHLDNESVFHMFNEAYRILKKDGYLRVTCPNIDLMYNMVLNNDSFFWEKTIKHHSKPENMKRINISKPMNKVSLKQIFLFRFASQVSVLHANKNTYTIDDKEFDKIFSQNNFEDALDFCINKCSLEIQKKNPGNHINWWNKRKLIKLLKRVGFKDVYLSAYSQSMSPVLRNPKYFDNTHPNESIYIEARK